MARPSPVGRGSRKNRQSKRTILVVTNGQQTELSYLKQIKQRANRPDASIKVEFVSGEPDSVLKKLKSPLGDTSGFDEVWLVVDEDGHDRTALLVACAKLCGKHQQWFAVISRPCFEVWLIAHYTNVRNYMDQGQAQKHFRQLIPKNVPAKQLPQDFPYDKVEQAIVQSHLANDSLEDLDKIPASPGTAMPHLVRALKII